MRNVSIGVCVFRGGAINDRVREDSGREAYDDLRANRSHRTVADGNGGVAVGIVVVVVVGIRAAVVAVRVAVGAGGAVAVEVEVKVPFVLPLRLAVEAVT